MSPDMETQKPIKKHILSRRRLSINVLVLCVVVSGLIASPFVSADQFDQRINELNNANAANAQAQQQLDVEAANLAGKIAALQSQITELQRQITENQAKSADLQKQITAAEEDLIKQKKILGENIKAMYLEGQISTLEMLASSKDLSDFVDKQQYRDSVKTKIKNSMDKIAALKIELKKQKAAVEQIIADQTTRQQQLDSARAESDRLLNLNQAQSAAIDQEIQNNYVKIKELRAQQAAENAKRFKGTTVVAGHNGNDTYPDIWRLAPQDSMLDNWGMYNRECVSYAAWKVASTGRNMPYWGGFGNANQWDDNARRMGISVDANPRPGDIAVAHWGYYGHVMYVESVNSNGTINISQYNWDFNGTYSEAYNFSTTGLVFIHF